jgi:hypothetical protein
MGAWLVGRTKQIVHPFIAKCALIGRLASLSCSMVPVPNLPLKVQSFYFSRIFKICISFINKVHK